MDSVDRWIPQKEARCRGLPPPRPPLSYTGSVTKTSPRSNSTLWTPLMTSTERNMNTATKVHTRAHTYKAQNDCKGTYTMNTAKKVHTHSHKSLLKVLTKPPSGFGPQLDSYIIKLHRVNTCIHTHTHTHLEPATETLAVYNKCRDAASPSSLHTCPEWESLHVWHDGWSSRRPSSWQ